MQAVQSRAMAMQTQQQLAQINAVTADTEAHTMPGGLIAACSAFLLAGVLVAVGRRRTASVEAPLDHYGAYQAEV